MAKNKPLTHSAKLPPIFFHSDGLKFTRWINYTPKRKRRLRTAKNGLLVNSTISSTTTPQNFLLCH